MSGPTAVRPCLSVQYALTHELRMGGAILYLDNYVEDLKMCAPASIYNDHSLAIDIVTPS